MEVQTQQNQGGQVQEGGKKPDMSFKAGAVEVSIWAKVVNMEGKEKTFYKLSWHLNYKGKDGEWKKTNNLNIQDVPKLQLVLSKAYEWVMLRGGK